MGHIGVPKPHSQPIVIVKGPSTQSGFQLHENRQKKFHSKGN